MTESVRSILVFGATGSCCQGIVERSLSRGLRVTAYVRNLQTASARLGTRHANLSLVSGSIADQERITLLVNDHDAVISCLSSFESPHTSMSTLTRCMVRAAERLDQQDIRFISYSLCGLAEDGDWGSHAIQKTLEIFSPRKFGPAIWDHRNVARLLESSRLNYTLFQTATMVRKPVGTTYRYGSPADLPGVRLWDRWGILDAADVCLDALNESGLKRLQMQYIG